MAASKPPPGGRQIAVIGAGSCGAAEAELAFRVGELLAAAGQVLLCGGLGGVMTAAARGARARGGVNIGIVPGPGRGQANPYIVHEIVTNLGHCRNFVIIHSADGVIALPGAEGTLAEIAIARKLGKPLVAVGPCWEFLPG
ncbi:MAG: TIGR00725 family protein, partial [Deltaproteobacteria bacterium]|nr:TIGR00725 family protein [Deltaproteobacteria bacterium]